MRKILLIALSLSFIFTACKKTDFDDTITGEAVGPLTLRGATSDSVFLNAAVPNQTVKFEWTAAAPGVNSTVNYRWIASLKSVNKFDAASRILEVPSDNNGTATTLTLTHKQLDDLLKAKNFTTGQRVELAWSVEAYNDKSGSTLANNSNIFIVRRMSDNGATPFQIFAPVNSLTPFAIDPNSTSSNLTFNWTRSMPVSGGPAIRYQVLFAERKVDAAGNELPVNWNSPLFRINSNNVGADTFVNVSYKAMNDSLTKYGFTNQATPANLKWTVVATSGTWNQFAEFSNSISLVREVKLFIVGGATPIGWTPTNALQFIEDAGRPGVYYMYTFLRGGNNGFKLLSMKADWGAAGQKVMGERNEADGSGNNATNNTGNLSLTDDGRNIAVPGPDGVYRITVNLNNNTYLVQSQHGRMGIVGGGTMADWNPGAVFPSQEMGFAETNLFVGITQVTSNGEFKMLDNNDWPNGNLNYTRDYEDGGNGKLVENGNQNFKWTEATGPVRVIWDYRDVNNPKYVVNSAREMRVVGNGMAGVPEWNPGGSPQMTYLGNGRWTITLNLIGGKDIKFLAGNDWGAFDYEDASGGSNATGTARKIKWEGGDNFKTPATSGSYTIVLDEYKQTVTIN